MMTLDDTPTITTRHRIRLIGALTGAVAAASIALPAAAGAQPATEPDQFAPSPTTHASVASSSGPVLRRDGSKAVPFVAGVEQAQSTAAGDFDWGDAGVGAGAALLLTMSGLGGALLVRNRRHRGERPATTA